MSGDYLSNYKRDYKTLIKTDNSNFFKMEWLFLKTRYENLPIKNELWIIGFNAPFVKLFSLKAYSPIGQTVISKYLDGTETRKTYFSRIERIIKDFSPLVPLYFPHRNEILEEGHKTLRTYKDPYFLEIIPLAKGYLPKIIIGNSTVIFSYLMIKRSTGKDFQVISVSQSDEVDTVYKEYGAEIYQN